MQIVPGSNGSHAHGLGMGDLRADSVTFQFAADGTPLYASDPSAAIVSGATGDAVPVGFNSSWLPSNVQAAAISSADIRQSIGAAAPVAAATGSSNNTTLLIVGGLLAFLLLNR